MTSVPAAEAGLLAALRSRAGLAAVQVAPAHPGKTIKAEAVYLDDPSPVQRAAALGGRRRAEEYSIEVVVSVLRKGNDLAGVKARMWALVAEVEEAVRADPTLGGAVLTAQVGDIDPQSFRDPSASVAEATVKVACTARI
jgi:hypothetical protein